MHTRNKSLGIKATVCIPCSRAATNEWRVKELSIHASAKISQSKDARHLQDSFGFVGTELDATILQPIDITLESKKITLICGASGAGKTLLINAVLQLFSSSDKSHYVHSSNGLITLRYSGHIDKYAEVNWLRELPASMTPLDMLGRASLAEFLAVTASAGLAEPQLLVRPIETLSSGQKYRLQIALSFLQKPDILIIDNFCEHLDHFTLFAVCKGIRNLVARYNVALMVATAGYERVQVPLDPDQKILLKRGYHAKCNSKNARHEI